MPVRFFRTDPTSSQQPHGLRKNFLKTELKSCRFAGFVFSTAAGGGGKENSCLLLLCVEQQPGSVNSTVITNSASLISQTRVFPLSSVTLL